MSKSKDIFISVDIETSGPIPGKYSLLQIGACCVEDNEESFSCLLKPINRNALPEALAVTGLRMDVLDRDGLQPSDAMRDFSQWIEGVANGRQSVFVGFNAPFDWSFINYYFHMYADKNPFGISAVDIKSMYMGAIGCDWGETRSVCMAKELGVDGQGDHDALHDAKFQADLFVRVRSLIDER